MYVPHVIWSYLINDKWVANTSRRVAASHSCGRQPHPSFLSHLHDAQAAAMLKNNCKIDVLFLPFMQRPSSLSLGVWSNIALRNSGYLETRCTVLLGRGGVKSWELRTIIGTVSNINTLPLLASLASCLHSNWDLWWGYEPWRTLLVIHFHQQLHKQNTIHCNVRILSCQAHNYVPHSYS